MKVGIIGAGTMGSGLSLIHIQMCIRDSNNDADVVKTSMENVEHAILSLTDSIGVIADAITGINTTIDEATVGVTDIAEKTGSVVTEAAQNAELVDTCMDSVEQLEKIADKFTL